MDMASSHYGQYRLGSSGYRVPGGRRMNDRLVRKLQKKIRRMHWHDRITLMDWMNRWYSDMKEQQRLEEEE